MSVYLVEVVKMSSFSINSSNMRLCIRQKLMKKLVDRVYFPDLILRLTSIS